MGCNAGDKAPVDAAVEACAVHGRIDVLANVAGIVQFGRIETVTEEEWAEYHKAEAAWKLLQDYPYFEAGGPDYPAELHEPQPRTETVYAESEDEWVARCKALLDSGFQPKTAGDFFREWCLP